MDATVFAVPMFPLSFLFTASMACLSISGYCCYRKDRRTACELLAIAWLVCAADVVLQIIDCFNSTSAHHTVVFRAQILCAVDVFLVRLAVFGLASLVNVLAIVVSDSRIRPPRMLLFSTVVALTVVDLSYLLHCFIEFLLLTPRFLSA